MPRVTRLTFDGGLYHLVSRGVRRGDVFLTDRDRLVFLRIFGEVVCKYGWVCYAFCLMDNHYHLLVETPEDNLSVGMRVLNSRYSKYFNRSHSHSGHSVDGRFHSTVVDGDTQMINTAKYIENNPVRAGIVDEAHEWEWNSVHFMLSGAGHKWLSVDLLASFFHKSPAIARQLYVDLLMDR